MECLKQKVENVLEKAVKEGFVAGASVLVLQDGKEILYGDAGYQNIEKGTPMTRETICRLYSMSKPITAAAVMILMERGEIDIADSVDRYLPGFSHFSVEENGKIVPAKRCVQIKDLLNMTSGCVYPGDQSLADCASSDLFQKIDERLYTDKAMTTVEIANHIGRIPAAFHPGEHWRYGTSADILGAIVEVVSGMRFGDFLKKEIFEPLGMADTGFFVPETKQNRLATVYENSAEGLREYPTNHLGIRYESEDSPAFESGGAGLFSTLDDYAKFASMLLHNGTYNGKQILKPATVTFLTSGELMPWQQADLDTGWETLQGHSYANLMRVMKNTGRAYGIGTDGEYGWDGWLGAYFCNSPKDDLTMLFFMQKRDSGTTELTRKLKNVIFSECKK